MIGKSRSQYEMAVGLRVPGALEQRLQDSILVFRSDLFLGDHLRHHLFSYAFQGLLFTVKNRHTWLKVTESNVAVFGLTLETSV